MKNFPVKFQQKHIRIVGGNFEVILTSKQMSFNLLTIARKKQA